MASPSRPAVIGPETGPQPPYPLRMSGPIIKGFGRGSKELGIPTANLPVDASATPWIADALSGVYFGWSSLALPADHPDSDSDSGSDSATTTPDGFSVRLFPMVMSIGYNPFYKNDVRSAEVHVLHQFAADLYDVEMRLLVLGFIREEQDYPSLDALVADINFDCEVARKSLARDAWTPREQEPSRGTLDGAWLREIKGSR